MSDTEKVASVLKSAAHAIRHVTKERDELREKLAHIERRQRAVKVASDMHDKGVNRDTRFEELVEDCEKAAADGRLDTISEALELVGPDMGRSVSLDDRDHGDANALEQFLLGDG